MNTDMTDREKCRGSAWLGKRMSVLAFVACVMASLAGSAVPRAGAEQQVVYTDMAVAYEKGNLELARRLARQHLEKYLELGKSTESPVAMESGVRTALGVTRTVLEFESRLPPQDRLGGDPELQSLLAESLEMARTRRGELRVTSAVAEYLRKEVGLAASQWLRVQSGRIPQERLEQIFTTFRDELSSTGISSLSSALGRRETSAPSEAAEVISEDDLTAIMGAVTNYFQGLVRDDPALLSLATGCKGTECGRILQALQMDLEEEGVAKLSAISTAEVARQDLELSAVSGSPGHFYGLVEPLRATLVLKDGTVVERSFGKQLTFRKVGKGDWKVLTTELPGETP